LILIIEPLSNVAIKLLVPLLIASFGAMLAATLLRCVA
jgi:hypothetical protein